MIGLNHLALLQIDDLFEKMEKAFNNIAITKEEIVSIMQEYLPSFKHIETGKSLDNKM